MPAIVVDALISQAATIVGDNAVARDRDLLLSLLEYAPNERGKAQIASKIVQGGDTYEGIKDHQMHLQHLADFFWRNLIIPVRVAGGRTPEPRSRMSRSGASSRGDLNSPAEAESVDDLKGVIDAANLRDSCRCIISGKVDPETMESGSFTPGGTGFEVTKVTHIIPFSLRDGSGAACALHLPAIRGALESFGGVELGSLMHGGINALDNVLTLSATVHRYFTELQIALEPMPGNPLVCRVHTWGRVAPRLGLPKTVKLRSASGAPPPNSAYLALHCAICKVLWSSGRAQELKDVLDDLEEVTLLAPDGSSANLINIAIYKSLTLTDGDL
ncbi:uncharacterized protein BXZ73DRAFT_88040 [Epithele typhae]|uniref:uncharacterized protein n=1 Tax=Epithele typhae TaxID=378194 RepID=UPI0020080B2B|nr:uncharacterized protein BXZ73DRAFT_88040 [Epithele typhae]KAH9942469.1 hypothetical protein BXZ73DRAFT_88040 [Epithele typhae]